MINYVDYDERRPLKAAVEADIANEAVDKLKNFIVEAGWSLFDLENATMMLRDELDRTPLP